MIPSEATEAKPKRTRKVASKEEAQPVSPQPEVKPEAKVDAKLKRTRKPKDTESPKEDEASVKAKGKGEGSR